MVQTAAISYKSILALTIPNYMRILLNILEIKKAARNNPDAEVLLTFALAVGPNRVISTNFTSLRDKLNISSVPQFLFTKGYLERFPTTIVSRFYLEEPQCYMTNPGWLHYKLPAKIKSDYLHILGQRSLSNSSNCFPEHYVDELYWKNPLITHADRMIKLTLEK